MKKPKTEYQKTVATLREATSLLKKLGYSRGSSKSDWERGKGDVHLLAPVKPPELEVPGLRYKTAYGCSLILEKSRVRVLGEDKRVSLSPDAVAELVVGQTLEEIEYDLNIAELEVERWTKARDAVKAAHSKALELPEKLRKIKS